MMARCVVMLVPIAAFFVTDGTITGMASLATAFALLLCLAIHGAMFLLLGRPCHCKADAAEAPAVHLATDVPDVARRPVATSEVA